MSNTADLPRVKELTTQIDACNAALASYRNIPSSDHVIRAKALQKVRHAAQALERAASTPAEQLSVVRNGGQRAAVLRLAIAIDLFRHVSETEALTINELAQRTNATPEFVHRITRALAALDFLVESDGGSPPTALYNRLSYTATPLGAYVATHPDHQASTSYIFDVHVSALCAMSDYIAQHGRQSPVDPLNCPVVFAQGAKDIDYFVQMQKRPDRAEKFAPEGGDGVVLVDVGSGDGRMLKRLREKFPGMTGRAVLQDLPAVIGRGTLVDDAVDVEVMAYDFFKGEQPVRGAAAYFHQHILHDWSDPACRTILRNLRPSMSPTSRLLLSEMIVEDRAPDINRCVTDMTMMVVGGQERSKSQWTALLASEGFRVLGFYGEGNAVNGVVEAVRDESWC